MLIVVMGGSGSGKSEFAEQCCVDLASEQKIYIATMEPFGKEGAARIARHRKLRAGKGFETLECYTHLEEATVPSGSTVLLECMSNLVANEVFSPAGRKDQVPDWVEKGIDCLLECAGHVVIVSNDIFCDGLEYSPETLHYMQALAEVNRRLAARADRLYEVVCGIPIGSERMSGSEERVLL